MASSTLDSAALALDETSEAPRDASDAARRYLEELLAQRPEFLDALSGLLASAVPEARRGEPEHGGDAGRAPLALARRLERAGPASISAVPDGPPHVCSWCRRVRVTPQRWVPAADYAREHGYGRRSSGAGVVLQLATNGICPDCYAAVVGHGGACGCGRGGHD